MYALTVRQLTADEMAEVQRRSKYAQSVSTTPTDYVQHIVPSLGCGFFLFVIPWILISLLVCATAEDFMVWGIVLYLITVLVFFGHFLWEEHMGRKSLLKNILALEKDVSGGIAECVRIRSDEVVQFIEDHGEMIDGRDDWGTMFVYRIDDDRVAYIQEFEDDEENGWPNDDFEVVRLPISKEELAIVYHGKRVKPCAMLDKRICKYTGDHHNGDIQNVNWSALVQGKTTINT